MGRGGGILEKLRSLDAYPKINDDFFSRTLSGGIITLFSSLLMLFLFFSELRLYLHTVTESKLLVDASRGETLHINFDVTFPAIRCSLLSLDTMDISGEQHFDIRHHIVKKRIDAHGNVIEAKKDGIGAPKIEKPLQRHGGRLEHNEKYCGSCFGAETCEREGFIQKVKDEVVKDVILKDPLKLTKWLEIFILYLEKVFTSLMFICMICWLSRQIVTI